MYILLLTIQEDEHENYSSIHYHQLFPSIIHWLGQSISFAKVLLESKVTRIIFFLISEVCVAWQSMPSPPAPPNVPASPAPPPAPWGAASWCPPAAPTPALRWQPLLAQQQLPQQLQQVQQQQQLQQQQQQQLLVSTPELPVPPPLTLAVLQDKLVQPFLEILHQSTVYLLPPEQTGFWTATWIRK